MHDFLHKDLCFNERASWPATRIRDNLKRFRACPLPTFSLELDLSFWKPKTIRYPFLFLILQSSNFHCDSTFLLYLSTRNDLCHIFEEIILQKIFGKFYQLLIIKSLMIYLNDQYDKLNRVKFLIILDTGKFPNKY